MAIPASSSISQHNTAFNSLSAPSSSVNNSSNSSFRQQWSSIDTGGGNLTGLAGVAGLGVNGINVGNYTGRSTVGVNLSGLSNFGVDEDTVR